MAVVEQRYRVAGSRAIWKGDATSKQRGEQKHNRIAIKKGRGDNFFVSAH